MNGFQGKTALVMGGTSGIGRETVLALASKGAHVVFTGRREAEGQKVAAAAREYGGRVGFVRGDVSDESQVKQAVAEAVKLGGGKLHFAFNNAGVELGGIPTTDSTVEQYRRVFDVNVLGVMLSMKHQIPAILASGGGSIVNNASVAGRIGMAGVGVYVASKHAVIGLTKSAAMETAKLGVRVNSVSPGAIETEMFDRFVGGEGEQAAKNREYMNAMHPIGRAGRAREIADPVLFLFSDASSFITGHDLVVDGGLTVP